MSSGLAYLGPEDLDEGRLLYRLTHDTPEVVACDVETVSLKDRRLIGIGVALSQQEAVYFRVMPDPSPHLSLVWGLLERANRVVLHNGIYDLTVIMEYLNGMAGNRPDDPIATPNQTHHNGRYTVPDLLAVLGAGRIADTSLMGQVQGLPGLELAGMSERYLDEPMWRISDILPERSTMLDVSFQDVARKCMKDCLGTLRLYYKMAGPLWDQGEGFGWAHSHAWAMGADPSEPNYHPVTPGMLDCYHVALQLIPVMLHMTARGKALRPDRVEHWYQKLSQQLLVYQDICDKEGFNPASPQQVGYILAARGNFLPFTKSYKQLQTNEELLSELSDPIAHVVLAHRGLSKLLGTYIKPYREVERAYTHLRNDLSSMRWASYDRNEQNIPPPVREIFEPDTGLWSWLDYSQIELRVAAEISQDSTMLTAYKNGDDIHTLTQLALWPNSDPDNEAQRLVSKTFNFAMLYRAVVKTLAKHTKLPVTVCGPYRDQWLDTYPELAAWQLEAIEDGWNNGYATSMYGRRMRLPHPYDMGGSVEHTEKCAVNYPIQGTAYDIIARAMLVCWRAGMDLALQVHDELLVDGVVDFPKELNDLGQLHTPFKVHRGSVWT